MPTRADWPEAIQIIAPNVRDARALRPEQPFVSIGRHEVDSEFVHIERKNAKALNRVKKHKRAALVGDLDDPRHIMPIAGRKPDPAHRHNSRSRVASVRQSIQIQSAAYIRRHAPCFDPPRFKIHPWIDIRRKLIGEGDDIVARFPIKSLGDQANSRRGVTD
jgi:hypothetical protein